MAAKPRKPPILAAIGDRLKGQPSREKHAHLDDDDKLVILWGLSRNWAAGKIARTVGCSPGTVKTFKDRIFDDPGLVFLLPVMVQAGSRVHQCQICGETRTTRTKGMRHVLNHIFPFEVARDMPMNEIEKPL